MSQGQQVNRRDLLKVAGGAGAALAGAGRRLGGTAAQDRERIRIWSPGDNGGVEDWDSDPILQAVEEATGIDIDITKIGFDVYTDQVNAAVASGDIPDVIATFGHNEKTIIGQWVRDEVVAPYEGEAAAANVLAQYQANPTLGELRYDDKVYMKPVSWGDGNEPNMGLLHVRGDLLETYGMTPPETFDEYFAFLRAAKDAGSSGVIFIGGGESGLGSAINAFAGAFGLPHGGWVKVDAGYQVATIQPGMRDALLLFRQMVVDDLIDPASFEIAVGDQARDRYISGAACSYIFNGGGHIGRFQNDMTLANPAFRECLLPAPDAGAGSRGYMSEPMFFGGTFLGALDGTSPPAAARVIDYLSSEEGAKLTALGVEGVDYEETDGEITLLPERASRGFPTAAGDTGAHPLASAIVSWVPLEWQEFSLLYGKDEAFAEFYRQMRANQVQHQIPSVGLLTTSPLWTDFQSTGSELTARYFLQVVQAGDEGEASSLLDQYVDEWRGAGGEDAQAEMSEILVGLYG